MQIRHAQHGNVLFECTYARNSRQLVKAALLAHTHLDWADLRGADLAGMNLHGIKLACADLRYASLWNATLHNADLTGTSLQFADLRDAQLHRAVVKDANLSYADLQHADCSYADFSLACLRYVDLRGVNFFSAYMRGVDLVGANMTGGTWFKDGTDNASLDHLGCDIDSLDFSAIFQDLKVWLDTYKEPAQFSHERWTALETVWWAVFNDGIAYAAKYARLCEAFPTGSHIRDLIIGIVRPRNSMRPKSLVVLRELQHILKATYEQLSLQHRGQLDAAVGHGLSRPGRKPRTSRRKT